MKKLLFLLLLLPIILSGQTVTLKAGTSAYVTINGQDYPRNGYLRFQYFQRMTDTAFSVIYSVDRMTFIQTTTDTFFTYADSANKKARNAAALQAWLRTNAY